MAREMKDSGVPWIGMVPANWAVEKLKFLTLFCQEKYREELGCLAYIGLENVVSWNGKFIETESEYDRNQSLLFVQNDILWGKLRPYLAKVFHCQESGCCSGEFCVIRPRSGIDVRYLWNTLISIGFVSTVDQSTYGTKMPRANADFIKNMLIPVPPVTEQKRIGTILDCKCVEIDTIIEKTRLSIEEFKKLKQAIITQAVTKGIRGDRPVKDSGVEWIPSIPTDWTVCRGKHLFRETNERSETGTEELLTVSHITGITPRSQKNVNMFMSESLVGYKVCHVGDIAANTMWMWQGAIGVSNYEGVISPSYNTYRQSAGTYESRYLDYLLRIRPLIDVYSLYSTGITASRLRLYPEQFLSLRFIVPPLDEQKEIADYLDSKVREVDSLILKKEQYLAEMEAYKKSLIYEYVTGKKEV